MTRLADGERAAFDEVYEACWPLARGFAAKLVGDEGDDVAQLALIKMLEGSSRYRRGADPVPWLLALVGWEARTLRKKRARRREEALPFERAAEHSDEVERRDLLRAATEVLGELDEEDRAIIAAAVDDEPRPPLSARDRKRRQRAFGRLRAAFWRSHG